MRLSFPGQDLEQPSEMEVWAQMSLNLEGTVGSRTMRCLWSQWLAGLFAEKVTVTAASNQSMRNEGRETLQRTLDEVHC